MLLIRHSLRVLGDLGLQALSTRRVGVLVLAVVGLVITAVVVVVAASGPLAVYPFV